MATDPTSQIVEKVLARTSNRSPEAVPRALIDAVAHGRGQRGEVLRAARETFETGKPLDLVLFDTDRIASYVFESSRPPVITGASAILRTLNATIREKDYQDSVLFSGGGEGMLLVPAGEGEEVCRQIEALYQKETHGALGVTTGFLPVSPDEFIALEGGDGTAEGVKIVSGTPAVLARLRDQARRKKDSKLTGPAEVEGRYERCASCRDRAAGSKKISDYRWGERGSLCAPCEARWEEGKKKIKGISFEEVVGISSAQDDSSRGKETYLGFLYIDGNAMGALFGDLPSLSMLCSLSEAVRKVFERLEARVGELVKSSAPRTKEGDVPLVSFLGGGDEAIWILPAGLALRVVEALPDWIATEAGTAGLPPILQEKTGHPSLTFGAGLVLCQHTYPVRYQYDLARTLQKNAKSMFYGDRNQGLCSSIDFEVLTDSSPLSDDLETARTLAYRTEEPGFFRTCRPYTVDKFKELLRRMLQVQVATSQLYGLQNGSGEGRHVFLSYVRYQIARQPAGEDYRKWIQAEGFDPFTPESVEKFFIHPQPGGSGLWITDGLQLLQFLNGTKDKHRRREG